MISPVKREMKTTIDPQGELLECVPFKVRLSAIALVLIGEARELGKAVQGGDSLKGKIRDYFPVSNSWVKYLTRLCKDGFAGVPARHKELVQEAIPEARERHLARLKKAVQVSQVVKGGRA